jgi:Pyruvate/2-oxoacid:ferredoxin oxidoreductase gamma subunit
MLPLAIYGLVVITKTGLAIQGLREYQTKIRMGSSTFQYQGGAIFHERYN